MNSNQLGRFYISEEFVRGSPEVVSKLLILLSFVPVRVENRFMVDNSFEYIGISKYFDKLDDGVIIPEYLITIKECKDGKIEIDHIMKTKNDIAFNTIDIKFS